MTEHLLKVTNFEKKKIIPLKNEQQKLYEHIKICYICKKTFQYKYTKDKKYWKFKDHSHFSGEDRDAANSICNLKSSRPKENPVVFHNSPNCDYHFIKKELSKVFAGKFNCLRGNTRKFKTFSFPITTEVERIDKNEEEITKPISYELQFIDNAKFMVSSLSNLVDNLAEEIQKTKRKHGHDNRSVSW